METKQLTTAFENVRLVYKNFKGERSKYNRDGARHFSMLLDFETAEELTKQGFNVRYPKPNPNILPEEDNRLPYLDVTVSNQHDYVNPSVKMFLVDGENVTRISSQDLAQVDLIDNLRLTGCDIQINPYQWVWDEGLETEQRGIKAYLSCGYFVISNDAIDVFASKYGRPKEIAESDLPF